MQKRVVRRSSARELLFRSGTERAEDAAMGFEQLSLTASQRMADAMPTVHVDGAVHSRRVRREL